MIASDYHIKRLASLLRDGLAEIRGCILLGQIMEYYVIDDFVRKEIWHVPVYKRPSWRKFEANENTTSTP